MSRNPSEDDDDDDDDDDEEDDDEEDEDVRTPLVASVDSNSCGVVRWCISIRDNAASIPCTSPGLCASRGPRCS